MKSQNVYSRLESFWPLALAVALVNLPQVARADAPEQQLIDVLKSQASAVEKNKACRALRTQGTEKAVPALAALLADAELSHPARLALETMPYPSADAALREAASRTTGRIRSGLIDSLGERRDAEAVPLIAAALGENDPLVVAASAWALGKIGTLEAAAALQAARDSATQDRREVIGQGLILCAKNLQRAGKTEKAAEIFHALSGSGEAKRVRAAALAGAVRAAGPKQAEVVCDFLKSADPLVRAAGAGALTDVATDELRELAANMHDFPPASQISILSAVRIRGDRTLAPAALDALGSTSDDVCLAAARALGVVGDASALPKLRPLAAEDGATAEAARMSIETLAGGNVDEVILAALRNEKDPKARAELVNVVAARRYPGAAAVLLEEVRNSNAVVRTHAMAGLTQLASPGDLQGLIAGVLAAQPGPERDAAELTIVKVMGQIKEPEERDAKMFAAVHGSQLALLPLGARFGGDAIAGEVQAAIASKDTPTHEAGVRALCNWPDASVADQLLALCEACNNPAQRAMLLHAYTRVVSLPRQGTDAERLARLKRAMSLAQDDRERAYVLERSGAVRTIDSLRFLLPYVDRPGTSEAACKSVAELAHHRELRDPNKAEFRTALEKVQQTSHDRLVLDEVKRDLDAMNAE